MAVFHEIDQRSEAWHDLRAHKLTGTEMSGLLGGPAARETSLYEMSAKLLEVKDLRFEGMIPMQRGVELEDEAIAAYEFRTGNKCVEVGFVESTENLISGHSPDRYLANDDGSIDDTHAVEVKCLGGGKHLRASHKNEIPKDYRPQAISYFVNNEKLWSLDFVLYNPEIPAYPLHIITIYRSDVTDEITEAGGKLEEFTNDVLGVLGDLGVSIK